MSKHILQHSLYQKALGLLEANFNIADKSFLLSISGGMDSMCLLFFFIELKKQKMIKEFRVVHFNHGLRKESLEEEEKLKVIFQDLNIDHQIIHLDLNKSESNLEMKAREKRYQVLNDILLENEICCLGHHLNDQFEWSLMRFFRSGEEDFLAGIPHLRFPFFRPLSEVSKDEIIDFQNKFQVPYFEDKTNFETLADRNFIRNELVPLIESRYPQYLKFYLDRQKNYFLKNNFSNRVPIVLNGEQVKIIYHQGVDSSQLLATVKNCIKQLSNKNRGSINTESQKLLKAIENKKTGPMLFSGNVYCWIDSPFLVFYLGQFPFESMSLPILLREMTIKTFMAFLQSNEKIFPLVRLKSSDLKMLQKVKFKRPNILRDNGLDEEIFSLGAIYRFLAKNDWQNE